MVDLQLRTLEHRIGGAATSGVSTRTSLVWDPATGAQQALVPLAEPDDVDAAVAAAAKAFETWRNVSVSRRSRILFAFRALVAAHVDDLARVIVSEHGKVLDDARGEVERGLDVVDFACGIAELQKGEYSEQVSTGIDSFSFRQPLGVCAGITPFNFPVMVPMWMHPTAIATGNTFILKPSERDPSVSNLVADLYAEAGLPDGVFNVLHGDAGTVGALLDHPGIAAVSFVGSTPIARSVHERAIAAGKRVQALGGAKNHAVVLADADLDLAAEQLVGAAYGSAGQRCMAVSVVVAVGDCADPLVEAIRAKAAAIRIGPGTDPSSEMGPVVTAQARDRVVDYVQRGSDAGAQLVLDGREIDAQEGFFVGPTLLDHVEPGMDVYRDEVFGPLLGVVRVPDIGSAIELINANPYANGTSIFTASGHAAREFQREVTVGMIGVNVPVPVPMAFHSFGGWKASLFGESHIHGPEGVRFYTRAKVVTTRWPADGAGVAGGSGAMHFPSAD
jgi:malonate-semialdehyde dehydrogenase (acetylating) / methylmalonate-semialdehyde dehydrogenase